MEMAEAGTEIRTEIANTGGCSRNFFLVIMSIVVPEVQEVPAAASEDNEETVERCCRICRSTEEDDAEEADLGKLIRPCACKGSLLYVHEVRLPSCQLLSPSPLCHYSCKRRLSQKCQEMWIKTYIRRSDKKPACEVCGQQFRISFTQPHKGLVGFLFSSQSPPLVHCLYLVLSPPNGNNNNNNNNLIMRY
jgi:hypothetical protein